MKHPFKTMYITTLLFAALLCGSAFAKTIPEKVINPSSSCLKLQASAHNSTMYSTHSIKINNQCEHAIHMNGKILQFHLNKMPAKLNIYGKGLFKHLVISKSVVIKKPIINRKKRFVVTVTFKLEKDKNVLTDLKHNETAKIFFKAPKNTKLTHLILVTNANH